MDSMHKDRVNREHPFFSSLRCCFDIICWYLCK